MHDHSLLAFGSYLFILLLVRRAYKWKNVVNSVRHNVCQILFIPSHKQTNKQKTNKRLNKQNKRKLTIIFHINLNWKARRRNGVSEKIDSTENKMSCLSSLLLTIFKEIFHYIFRSSFCCVTHGSHLIFIPAVNHCCMFNLKQGAIKYRYLRL